MVKIIALWCAGILFIAIVAVAALLWYALQLPGQSYTGPLPPLSSAEQDLAKRLKQHVTAIASKPHNIAHYAALEEAATYIESELRDLGYTPRRQEFEVDGKAVHNIEVIIPPPAGTPSTASIVAGAHYDSDGTAPGADDNASGVAVTMELARLLKDFAPKDKTLRLVLFVNEESPYYRSPVMGSWRYARDLKQRGENVAGMMSLEMLGAYSDEPNSQKYPAPFGLFFPTTADFIAFVALPGGRSFLHEVVGAFRQTTKFPTIGGTAPDFIEGIGWSDHWSFAEFGYPAIMITDTSFFRYPYYHTPNDTPDKLAYGKMARVTKGLERTLRELLE